MSYSSLLLVIPPVLLGLALLASLLKRHSARWLFLPAVLSCHLVAAALLWIGGMDHPVVRAELQSLGAVLEDAEGKPVSVTIGGADGHDDGEADTFLVPEYPPEAFEFRQDKHGAWHLAPGKGWRPELIVWSGGQPLMMEEGIPALIPLSSGDRLQLGTMKEQPALELIYEEKQPWKRTAQLRLDARTWTLPNREIEIPVLGWQVPLLTRQTWRQRVYPLSDAGFTTVPMRSVILHGLDHEEARGKLFEINVHVLRKSHRRAAWQHLSTKRTTHIPFRSASTNPQASRLAGFLCSSRH